MGQLLPIRNVYNDDAASLLRVQTLRAYSIMDTPREQVFDRFVFIAAQLFRVPIALISLLDDKRQWFKARVGLNLSETPLSEAFCARTIGSDDVTVVEDTLADPEFRTNALVTGPPHIRFYAGAPLITPEGVRLGGLCVIDRSAKTVGSRQVWQLAELARSVVGVMGTRLPTPLDPI